MRRVLDIKKRYLALWLVTGFFIVWFLRGLNGTDQAHFLPVLFSFLGFSVAAVSGEIALRLLATSPSKRWLALIFSLFMVSGGICDFIDILAPALIHIMAVA